MTDNRLSNADIAPVPLEARNWGVGSIAALWVGMAVCIPTYSLAAGMISQGMSWRQAVLTVGAPGRKAGLAHPKYDVFKKDPLLQYAAGSGADTARAGILEKHPLGPKIYEEIGRVFAKAWEGKATPEDAALEAHHRVSEIIKSA